MSTNFAPRRSKRLSAQKEAAANQPQMPLLPRFPAEIIRKILCSVLVCPEHLSFTRLPLSVKERAVKPRPNNPRNWQAMFSDVLRLCLWNKCANDEPEAPALHGDFGALCLVSKEIRNEARNVFFSKNRWVLDCSSSFDAIAWVLKYWGQDAVRSMTDLRLELQVIRSRLVQFYQSLVKFSDALKDGHSLQRLSMQWIAGGRPLQCARPRDNNWSPHAIYVDRDLGLERNSEGGRGREDWKEEDGTKCKGPGSEPKGWAAMEVVLQPLKGVRGVRHVRVEGMVTDAWAEYLEMVISAPVGTEFSEFDLQETPREWLEKLEKDIEPSFIY